jgi:transcriptional antiterminator RfaH
MSVIFDNAWYCARTKPKHEHLAAANLSRNLGLEVFNPRLRIERPTRRGIVRLVEPLFPCYLFVCCTPDALNELRYETGISSLVRFGEIIPTVPASVIAELKECFEMQEPLAVADRFSPGAEVSLTEGAFCGLQAIVLRTLPARQRVQILLDILGRPTLVEVDRHTLTLENRNLAELMPSLAVMS